MPFLDPEYRVYRRKWYANNKKSEIAHVQRRKKRIKRWLWDYKKTLRCSICLESHPAIIDFHHRKGKKEKSISQMLTDGHSVNRIKQELTKCDTLCANCHRKTHFKNNKL